MHLNGGVYDNCKFKDHFPIINTQKRTGERMGNDGGDIPGRKELVKQRQKTEAPNVESIAIGRYCFSNPFRSRFCNLTNQKFKQPLAICKLGNIYNYENVLEALVKKQLPSKYSYIRKLTDIKQVIIERAPAYSDNVIACPITKLEYNGFNKFVGLWTCGHVFSRKAFKEIKSKENECMICQEQFQKSDIIDLNLEGERLEHMRNKLIEKQMNKKKEKMQKKQTQTVISLKRPAQVQYQPNPLERLGGQFRDLLRDRKNFKDLFQKQDPDEWKVNTYFCEKKIKKEEEKE